MHKKIENSNVFEEHCRDILGNESCFIFSLDKLINSLIKTVNIINNDSSAKETVNLFLYESKRKNALNENLYYADYVQLADGHTGSHYRILYSSDMNIMTIHLVEFTNEQNRCDYITNYKTYMFNVLTDSYQKLIEENKCGDEPFTVFLDRNIKLMKKKKNTRKMEIFDNNLQFRVNQSL